METGKVAPKTKSFEKYLILLRIKKIPCLGVLLVERFC
jgi:hypothetical protein